MIADCSCAWADWGAHDDNCPHLAEHLHDALVDEIADELDGVVVEHPHQRELQEFDPLLDLNASPAYRVSIPPGLGGDTRRFDLHIPYWEYEPIEGDDHDLRYVCTCKAMLPYAKAHPKSCDVSNHKGWTQQDCDWDPVLFAYVYYHEDETLTIDDFDDASEYSPAWGAGKAPRAELDELFGVSSTTAKTTTFYTKCRHYEHRVEMPDGTVVYASSMNDGGWGGDKRTTRPDLGVYLADWRPDWLAYLVPWRDYGLPKLGVHEMLGLIEEIVERARAGQTIEIGCVGGHGRTGTMLALVALHCGVTDAVGWVRDAYCEHAVEGDEQEWYVELVAARMRGEAGPPRPPAPPPAPKKTATSAGKSSASFGGYNSGYAADLAEKAPLDGPFIPPMNAWLMSRAEQLAWMRKYLPANSKGVPYVSDDVPYDHHHRRQCVSPSGHPVHLPTIRFATKDLTERCNVCGVLLGQANRQQYACWNTFCSMYMQPDTRREAWAEAEII